jgi:hypothetical protein
VKIKLVFGPLLESEASNRAAAACLCVGTFPPDRESARQPFKVTVVPRDAELLKYKNHTSALKQYRRAKEGNAQ